MTMNASPSAHLYAHTSVWFWPFLWWQLFRLELWIEATGRDVMVAVDHCGNLYITRISDDPDAPRPWTPSAAPHDHQNNLNTRLPGEGRDQWRLRLQAIFSDTRPQFVIPDLTLPSAGPGVRDPVEFWVWFCKALSPAGTLRQAGSGLAAPAHEPSSGLCSLKYLISSPDAKRRAGHTR